MDFKDVIKLRQEYLDGRKNFRDSVRLWLHEKAYYSYSVRIDNDVIRLEGSGETITGEDISEFMKKYNVVLTYKSRNHIIDNGEKRNIWGKGERYINQYIFR